MKRDVLLSFWIAIVTVALFGCGGDPHYETEVDVIQQELVVYADLPTSGVSIESFAVNPGEFPTYLIMSSPSSGTWKYQTYGSPISLGTCTNPDFMVYTYWRDTSVSYNWNFWGGGGPVCYPTSLWSTTLYSGSSTIQYKFVYENYADYGQTVYAKFTKQ